MEVIEENPNKLWNWRCISENPNLTMKFIEENPDKPWDWISISWNEFNYDKYIRDQAARIIQRGCHDWLWKPILKDGKPGIVLRLSMQNDPFLKN
jgi:hypothetical protein